MSAYGVGNLLRRARDFLVTEPCGILSDGSRETNIRSLVAGIDAELRSIGASEPVEDSDYWCKRFAALVVSLDESRTAAENQRDALANALEEALIAMRAHGMDYPAKWREALRDTRASQNPNALRPEGT